MIEIHVYALKFQESYKYIIPSILVVFFRHKLKACDT